MTIKYVGEPPTEDGYYLLRVDDGLNFNQSPNDLLEIAYFRGDTWEQTGSDYDYWQYDQRTEYQIEVIAKLDLDTLAKTIENGTCICAKA